VVDLDALKRDTIKHLDGNIYDICHTDYTPKDRRIMVDNLMRCVIQHVDNLGHIRTAKTGECPLGKDCDLTIAYMMGQASKKAAGEWLPIESAPKDGTRILSYSPDRCGNCPKGAVGLLVVWWDDVLNKWLTGRTLDGMFISVRHTPTLWKPIDPPSSAAGEV